MSTLYLNPTQAGVEPCTSVGLIHSDPASDDGTADISGLQLIKKRARDRRAQQMFRARQASRFHDLESRLLALEEENRDLHYTCDLLYKENKVLHSRQEAIGHTVASWGCLPNPAPLFTNSLHELDKTLAQLETTASVSSPFTLDATTPGSSISQSAGFSQDIPSQQLITTSSDIIIPQAPEIDNWGRIPVHDENDVRGTEYIARLLAHPSLVDSSPDRPTPVEVLYGSRTNFLANIIYEASRRWPWGEPERFAMCWLTYHFVKWTNKPGSHTFSQLCAFQRPISEQLIKPHAHFIDFICWPQLRANMIRHQHLYNAVEANNLMTCCQKLRWPWRKPFLLPDENGNLVIIPEFYSAFTNLDCWGLTDEYINYLGQYPGLLDGIDVDSLRYRFVE